MANNRKRKKPTQRPNSRNDEFDLKHSLNRVNQKQKLPDTSTLTEQDFEESERRQTLNSDQLAKEGLEETKLILSINERFSDKLESIKDDITDAKMEIGKSSDCLRQELEVKIEKKLDKQWYVYTIIGLVALVTIIYTFSYSDIVSNTKTNSSEVKKYKDKFEEMDNQLEELDEKHHSIEKRTYELEIKEKMHNNGS